MGIKNSKIKALKLVLFYDSLNLLAGCIKLPKLMTDSLSQIRLTVQAEEH